eukprot:GHVU01095414.1.p1 GENE.GHVU01095414.1~~GHVU01095414.1.p1  ORF type:complete len:331 (-),score=22.29 GHVU01095414.1:625-1617(-)
MMYDYEIRRQRHKAYSASNSRCNSVSSSNPSASTRSSTYSRHEARSSHRRNRHDDGERDDYIWRSGKRKKVKKYNIYVSDDSIAPEDAVKAFMEDRSKRSRREGSKASSVRTSSRTARSASSSRYAGSHHGAQSSSYECRRRVCDVCARELEDAHLEEDTTPVYHPAPVRPGTGHVSLYFSSAAVVNTAAAAPRRIPVPVTNLSPPGSADAGANATKPLQTVPAGVGFPNRQHPPGSHTNLAGGAGDHYRYPSSFSQQLSLSPFSPQGPSGHSNLVTTYPQSANPNFMTNFPRMQTKPASSFTSNSFPTTTTAASSFQGQYQHMGVLAQQ